NPTAIIARSVAIHSSTTQKAKFGTETSVSTTGRRQAEDSSITGGQPRWLQVKVLPLKQPYYWSSRQKI
ncbi:MAG: hypothetical protein QGG39_17795, partial [Candidatus Poribacteria bacterium]|nr:hypothetical protein [Candidatus Poribacteria bacterium]